MKLNQLPIIQRAKALTQIREQVQPILPPGVHFLNVREGDVWVLGCAPLVRVRLRFMIPELEKKIAQVVGRTVHIHLKTYMEFPEPEPSKPPKYKISMSAETKAKMLMDAELISDEKLRYLVQRIAR